MIRLLVSLILSVFLTGASTSVNVPITVTGGTPTAIAVGSNGCSGTACVFPNIDTAMPANASCSASSQVAACYIGTVSTTVSSTPPFSGSYQLLSSNPGGGTCGTGTLDNTHFSLVGDALQAFGTSGAPAASGTAYNVCVKATSGGSSLTQEFTVTVGNFIDAEATYCAANGGGNGTSGSPWQDRCIIAAINAASTGDTVFLAAGNWQLPITVASATGNITNGADAITSMSTVTGIAIGQTISDNTSIVTGGTYPSSMHNLPGDPGQKTFQPTVTAINSGCTPTPCVVMSANAQATATGDTFGFGYPIVTAKDITLVGAGSGNTFDTHGHPNNGKGAASGSPTRIYVSGSPVYGPGGFISFYNCSGTPGPVVSHIFFDGSNAIAGNQSDGGGDFAGEINFIYCNNPTVNDVRVLAFNTALFPQMPNAHLFVFGDGSHGSSVLRNSISAEPFASGYSGAQVMQEQNHDTVTMDNNIFYQGSYNGFYLDDISYTRNANYMFNDGSGNTGIIPTFGPGGCATAGCGFAGQTGNSHLYFRNNLFYTPGNDFGMGPNVNDPGTNGIVNDIQMSGNWLITTGAWMGSCAWRFWDSDCLPTGSPDTSNPSAAMQVDTLSETNNSISGTTATNIDFQGNGCGSNPANPGQGSSGCAAVSGTLPTGENWMTCNTCSATQNYLSGPSNNYLTDTHSVSPSQSNNYCATSSFSGCNTTGFTTVPTVSFTLGNLYEVGGTYYVPLTNESFTAQYGAVQWYASTSSSCPASNSTTWSSNNTSFPQSQLNTYVPPVTLSGVAHGSTVYVCVMDSAGHVSSSVSHAIP